MSIDFYREWGGGVPVNRLEQGITNLFLTVVTTTGTSKSVNLELKVP